MNGARHWFRRLVRHRPRGKTVVLFVGIGLTIASFQNCGKVSLVTAMDTTAKPIVSLSETIIKVVMNQPKTTGIESGLVGAKLSFESDSDVTAKTLDSATVTLDSDSDQITITPVRGFRGEVPVTVYATSGLVTNVQHITFVVENPVLNVKPALAVRGAECIMCHANLQGDMITDFGLKQAHDSGPDVFLTSASPSFSGYGMGHQDAESFPSASINGSILMPSVKIADIPQSAAQIWHPVARASIPSSVATLADYLTKYEAPTNAGYLGVVEKKEIYIGAPTRAQILEAGSLGATKLMSFYKNDSAGPDLANFSRFQSGAFDFYTNDPAQTMVCEGDLFIDGVVFLNNLTVQTTAGCRIYATRTVFINGPIKYKNIRALTNIEVTSAIGVFMGFGSCFDCRNSSPSAQGQDHQYAGKNTLAARWATSSNVAIGQYRTMTQQQIYTEQMNDFAKVSDAISGVPAGDPASYVASHPTLRLIDGTNTYLDQANTGYTRIMLNAPVVWSRYGGDFTGTVIAEFAMWQLGGFTFSFDTVFMGVPLFPFLDFSKILSVTDLPSATPPASTTTTTTTSGAH